MTIKRFELCANEVDCYHITDLETGKRYTDLNLEEICTLLNSLDMTATNAIEALDVLNEENKQLKSKIQTQKQIIDKQEMKLAEYNNQINVSTN